jgi:hypothetical protein
MGKSFWSYSTVRAFYAEHRGWRALLVSSLILTYAGGAALFWYHAIYLDEGGPAISPWHHWLLDSTAGFVGLTPAIALILPIAHRFATTGPDGAPPGGTSSPSSPSSPRVHTARFSIVGGTLLAFVTAPAPILHDELIGQGTWLAGRVTELFGRHHVPTGSEHEVPEILEMVQQVAAAIPIYIVLMSVTLVVLRALQASGPPVRPGG